VDQIIYTNIGNKGEYKEVVYMNEDTGECRFADANRTFSGETAPFNEPVTLIFRGPIHLKQLAVYTPSGAGAFSRNHYYNAASQTSQGLTFLGNRGGEGSGVVGGHFGASLSYINPTASGGSSTPQILANEVIANEFLVMTDQDCDFATCGYVRPGSIAKKGFPGTTSRIFLLEFSMPHTASTGGGDMPAIWLENARVCPTRSNTADVRAGIRAAASGKFSRSCMPRPVDQNAPIKVAVWLDPVDGGTASVKILGTSDGAQFGGQLNAGEVSDLKKRSAGLVSETDYAIATVQTRGYQV
ncbi:putative TOS1-like glycosyl hydrolase-domain-containing protein, partial [Pseudoneurospora amorphoporcata]